MKSWIGENETNHKRVSTQGDLLKFSFPYLKSWMNFLSCHIATLPLNVSKGMGRTKGEMAGDVEAIRNRGPEV